MAWHGEVAANRREDSLIDDPATYNRLLCGCLTRLPGIRRAALAHDDPNTFQFRPVFAEGKEATELAILTQHP